MNGEIIKLLEMCKNGTLTVEATEELLDAIYRGDEENVTVNVLPWNDDNNLRVVAFLGHKLLSAEEASSKNTAMTVEYAGEINNLECQCACSVHCGDVKGNVSTAETVNVTGNVGGSVRTAGTVNVGGDVAGNISTAGAVNCRSFEAVSSGAAKVNVTSGDFKNFGSSISEMVKHSLDFATDAINSASDKIKKEYRKNEAAKNHAAVMDYENVTDMPNDDTLRIAVIKGNTVIKSSEIVDKFTVDMGDYDARDVYCSGNLICGSVNGDITAVNVTCDAVDGNISGCQSVTCDEVDGDISDCDRVTCDDVNGDVTRCQNVTCDSVDGDVRDCGAVNIG